MTDLQHYKCYKIIRLPYTFYKQKNTIYLLNNNNVIRKISLEQLSGKYYK